jgi:hypothetical protein
MRRVWAIPVFAAALWHCGNPESPALAERLQGNWGCDRKTRDGEYLRTDLASLEVRQTSIKYGFSSTWECDTFIAIADGSRIPECKSARPQDRIGYFEGIFEAVGDSLKVVDGTDTLSFRNVGDGFLDFLINGLTYPMTRN